MIESMSLSAISTLPLSFAVKYQMSSKFGSGFRRDAPSAGRGLLGGDADATSLFHFFGQLSHRFRGNSTSLAMRKRSLRSINRRENLRAGALTFFPEGQSLLDGLFFAVQASAINRLPDEGFLIGCEMYFHRSRVGGREAGCQRDFAGGAPAPHSTGFAILKDVCRSSRTSPLSPRE